MSITELDTSANPLLERHTLPPFGKLAPEHTVPAITALIEGNLRELEVALAGSGEAPTWLGLIAPLEDRADTLNQAWAPVSHLQAVADSAEWRTAYAEAQALLTDYYTQMGQNQGLFAAYEALKAGPEYADLPPAAAKAVDNALRDFQLSGVALMGEERTRYGEIAKRLSELGTAFGNRVLDATQAWSKHITDDAQLEGLSKAALASARQIAAAKGLEGYLLTLDGPSYLNVMMQADDAALRRELYTAYMTRASDQGPNAGEFDNTDTIEEIVQLRQEMARLLGFANYSELSVAPKMADTPEQVLTFLADLAERARPRAQQELRELAEWAAAECGAPALEVWDVPYYSEKLRQARFDVNQEALRPYFTWPRVLAGLFELCGRLFDITIEADNAADPLYHQDAKFYTIRRGGEPLAHFYLDPFARDGKRGGAWMAECRVRRRTADGMQRPVAFLVCNFGAPAGGTPAQLTHNEVTTLFHEFGHGLHHMLTQVDVAAVSGINGVAWDAVELPSQFMENFCWQPEVLRTLTAHVDTGEALPDPLIDKMLAARTFQSALMLLRQVEFAVFDLRLHMEYGNEDFSGVQALLDEVRRAVGVLMPPDFNRFQCGFSHIFAGGYAAGYYSYKWAEVLSADAFAAFEEQGLFDEQTGRRFRECILEAGGSADAAELFERFRGRPPEIDALLRHSGIAA